MRKNYILMPKSGTRYRHDAAGVKDFFNMLNTADHMSLKSRYTGRKRSPIQLQIIDSMHANGAKLVGITDQEMAELRMSYPGVRIVPEVFYHKAVAPRLQIALKPAATHANAKYAVQITCNGNPVEKAEIFLYTNFKAGEGARAFTNKSGSASFTLPALSTFERMYVYPLHSAWPARVMCPQFEKNAFSFDLPVIDTTYETVMHYFYPLAKRTPVSARIKVGVIDTGVGPHRYISVKGGMNFVRNEDKTNFTDGDGHGTHVAGIIAGNGEGGEAGFRGLAPGVTLYSYRVFGTGGSEASNFAIMKAIDRAVADGCDLINLSLGSASADSGIAESISEAYNKGVVCFAATGNEDRAPVSFPASAQFSIAVGAFGRKKTWPENCLQADMIRAPYGKDKNNFVASFSNIGTEVDLIAPGVGIISGYPNNGYAVLDGTSMACPAATAIAARLLDANPEIYQLSRSCTRSNEIIKLVSAHAADMGFAPRFQGKGLLVHG